MTEQARCLCYDHAFPAWNLIPIEQRAPRTTEFKAPGGYMVRFVESAECIECHPQAQKSTPSTAQSKDLGDQIVARMQERRGASNASKPVLLHNGVPVVQAPKPDLGDEVVFKLLEKRGAR